MYHLELEITIANIAGVKIYVALDLAKLQQLPILFNNSAEVGTFIRGAMMRPYLLIAHFMGAHEDTGIYFVVTQQWFAPALGSPLPPM